MSIPTNEQQKAISQLQRAGVKAEEIQSFTFMTRAHDVEGLPLQKQYGAGILTLKLKGGKEQVILLKPQKQPTAVIRYLLSQGIPFSNLRQLKASAQKVESKRYKRSSIYMFFFFLLFLLLMTFAFYTIQSFWWWVWILGGCSAFVGIFLLTMLMTRFCCLSFTDKGLVVHSVGRSICYPYEKMKKVNFEFAREQAFTHIMEILDDEFRYRKYYIGRVSRHDLPEIAEKLQQAGVDATCSLNPEKRYYEDTQMFQ